MKLLYDPTVTLLNINSKELKAGSLSDICTTMFIIALFTIAKTWKQLTCQSADEWINKMLHIHTLKYTALKKKVILICHNMEEP